MCAFFVLEYMQIYDQLSCYIHLILKFHWRYSIQETSQLCHACMHDRWCMINMKNSDNEYLIVYTNSNLLIYITVTFAIYIYMTCTCMEILVHIYNPWRWWGFKNLVHSIKNLPRPKGFCGFEGALGHLQKGPTPWWIQMLLALLWSEWPRWAFPKTLS